MDWLTAVGVGPAALSGAGKTTPATRAVDALRTHESCGGGASGARLAGKPALPEPPSGVHDLTHQVR
jgi:hypothetical protein